MTRIKRAVSEDAEAVRRLVREAYAEWVPLIGREPMPMKADYERAVRDHEIDLLYADDELVALIELIVHSDHLFIENVAVTPRRQGQGFGRYLLSHAEEKARKAELGELRLLTNQAFGANIHLYESVGFRIDRTEPFAGGGTTVYMSKAIAGPDAMAGIVETEATGLAPAAIKARISITDLEKIDIRVGTIERVEDVPRSDKLLKLTVNFGDHKRSILVGMRLERADPITEVEGRQALFVVNLEPRKMAGEISEGMLFDIGYSDGFPPVLAVPERPVPDGSRGG